MVELNSNIHQQNYRPAENVRMNEVMLHTIYSTKIKNVAMLQLHSNTEVHSKY